MFLVCCVVCVVVLCMLFVCGLWLMCWCLGVCLCCFLCICELIECVVVYMLGVYLNDDLWCVWEVLVVIVCELFEVEFVGFKLCMYSFVLMKMMIDGMVCEGDD